MENQLHAIYIKAKTWIKSIGDGKPFPEPVYVPPESWIVSALDENGIPRQIGIYDRDGNLQAKLTIHDN